MYDHSGRLLLRHDGDGSSQKFYYDGINTLMIRKRPAASGSCYRTESAFVLKDAAIGQILSEMRYNYATDSCAQSPTTSYVAYHYDHIGNVVAISDLLNSPGSVVEAFDMDAFGNMKQGSQDGIRLTTKHYDPDSKLYYFGSRWYEPQTGRWMEKEPSGFNGPNYYHFNYSNPIGYFDPDGRRVYKAALVLYLLSNAAASSYVAYEEARNCYQATENYNYWQQMATLHDGDLKIEELKNKAYSDWKCACGGAGKSMPKAASDIINVPTAGWEVPVTDAADKWW